MNDENTTNADNLEQAMNAVADVMEHTISTRLEGDNPADKQVLIRATDIDRERWKNAAQKEGKSLAQFLRDTINEKVVEILECSHPQEQRRVYPWAQFCLRCNQRL
jgi:predicted HicB family RNase H-like nuclease